MKQLEAARYEQEIKMAQKEAEEEKVRRKQAYQRSAIFLWQTGDPVCHLQSIHSEVPVQFACLVLLTPDHK